MNRCETVVTTIAVVQAMHGLCVEEVAIPEVDYVQFRSRQAGCSNATATFAAVRRVDAIVGIDITQLEVIDTIAFFKHPLIVSLTPLAAKELDGVKEAASAFSRTPWSPGPAN